MSKIKKIEIELPDEIYEEFNYLCKKKDQKIKEKIMNLILNAIFSAEIDNF